MKQQVRSRLRLEAKNDKISYNQLLSPAHQGQQKPFSENGFCLFLHNRVPLCLGFF